MAEIADYQLIRASASDSGLLTVFLARPPVNVINRPMITELLHELNRAAEDPSVRAILITGEGQRVFSAGVAIDDHRPDQMDQPGATFSDLLSRMRRFPLPLVAAVNRAALGGGLELALACDMILSQPDARIGQPEIKLASMAAPAMLLLQGRLPAGIIAEMICGGEPLSGTRSHELGLVNRLIPVEGFLAGCEQFMAQFTSLSRPAMNANKAALNHARGRLFETEIEHLLDILRQDLLPTHDAKEGLDAFEQKRPPAWLHR